MKHFVNIIIFLILILIFSLFYVANFISQKTNTSIDYFPRLLINSYRQPTLIPDFNFMILGLDPRHDSLEDTITTDTIILAHLDSSAKIKIISIPRDLWVYSLKSKINQIYPLSLLTPDRYKFIESEFGSLTGQNISRTVIITTQSLIKLTNLVGGVDLVLPEGFKDEQYPNQLYTQNPSPKIPKYITVEFKTGPVHLDESNITEFVRSRKSITGGTDIGRILRQQLLLEALINKLKSPNFYQNTTNLSNLYKFFKSDISTNLTDSDILSLGLKLYPNISGMSLSKVNIPTAEYPKIDILYHPKTFINAQWVFIPEDKDYQSFKLFIQNFLAS